MTNPGEETSIDAIAVRACLFHVLFDSDVLSDYASSTTHFFVDRLKRADGTTKFWGHECNFGSPDADARWGSGPLLQGQQKYVNRLAIHVQGAGDDDEFEVRFTFAGTLYKSWKMKVGFQNAVTTEAESPITHKLEPVTIVALESWRIEVVAPEKFRGHYARVSLIGPLLHALPLAEKAAS